MARSPNCNSARRTSSFRATLPWQAGWRRPTRAPRRLFTRRPDSLIRRLVRHVATAAAARGAGIASTRVVAASATAAAHGGRRRIAGAATLWPWGAGSRGGSVRTRMGARPSPGRPGPHVRIEVAGIVVAERPVPIRHGSGAVPVVVGPRVGRLAVIPRWGAGRGAVVGIVVRAAGKGD